MEKRTVVRKRHAGLQNYPDSIKQLVGATKKQVKTINMEQFKAALDKKELGVIVDVRNPDEYATGFVPGPVMSGAVRC